MNNMMETQEMFMLFFSILYGIMLNSLIGRGAFPITSALSCKDMEGRKEKMEKDAKGEPDWKTRDRSCRRFVLSIFVLNVFPLIYFAVAFQSMGYIGDVFSTTNFNAIFQILSIGLIALSVFAFYYFFLGAVTWKKNDTPVFYTEYQWKEQYAEKVFYDSVKNHFIAGALYLALPWGTALLFKVVGLLS